MKFSKKIISVAALATLLILSSTNHIKNTSNSKIVDTKTVTSIADSVSIANDKSNSQNNESNSVPSNITSSPIAASVPNPNTKIVTSDNSNATINKSSNSTAIKTSKNSASTSVPKTETKSSEASSKAPTPQPVPTEPKPAPISKPSSDKLILGYSVDWNQSSLSSLTANSSLIDEVATHTYIVTHEGTLTGTAPASQISFANKNGIKTIAVVRNEFNSELAHDVLTIAPVRANLIKNIEAALAANNYKGVNIDFEILKPADRDALSNFMKELYTTLKPKGYIVSIAVQPKRSDSETWVKAFDYATLGEYSDQVVLMTYDEHYPGGTPGPIASEQWVQQVVNYASSKIPKNKLLLGLAAYGYDWTVKDEKTISTKSLSIQSAYSTASANEASVLWNDVAKVPYFTYNDSKGSHTVYFENNMSIAYKLNIVNNSNLKGIAIWRLGLEDSRYWTTIKQKLNK